MFEKKKEGRGWVFIARFRLNRQIKLNSVSLFEFLRYNWGKSILYLLKKVRHVYVGTNR